MRNASTIRIVKLDVAYTKNGQAFSDHWEFPLVASEFPVTLSDITTTH